jgi:putative IMPACT (imprinted ancient) family translation regulator
VGYEFFTDIEPDPGSAPDWPQWTEGRPGVKVIEQNELVAIAVVVTKRQDAEQEP